MLNGEPTTSGRSGETLTEGEVFYEFLLVFSYNRPYLCRSTVTSIHPEVCPCHEGAPL